MYDCVPACMIWPFAKLFKCCRLSKEERLFAKARDTLDDEIDIINVVKKLRKMESYF